MTHVHMQKAALQPHFNGFMVWGPEHKNQ